MSHRIIGILSVLSFVVACGDSPLAPSEDIVGAWQIESANGGVPFSTTVYTFSSNGNLTIAFPLLDESNVTTYVISRDQLTINGFTRGVDESGRAITVPTTQYQIVIEGNRLTMTDSSDSRVTILSRA